MKMAWWGELAGFASLRGDRDGAGVATGLAEDGVVGSLAGAAS
jgi:hypothetical protein